MPKRKHDEVDQDGGDSLDAAPESIESNDDSSHSGNSVNCGSGSSPNRKRSRKSVNFEKVDVFYFPRAQGFACVPSQGGTTLGMSEKHAHQEEYPLKHYRKLRKLVRRKKAEVEESAENSFSIDAINDISQDEIVQTDSEEDDTETDGFFLQPVPIKLRRSLLKLSGVKKVDSTEREECKELRGSREECGCDCKTVCIPETCLCAINGIQCQVDRFSFPCGCSKKGCHNPSGRIEFNPGKVRKHYQHTMKRLQNEDYSIPAACDSDLSNGTDQGRKKSKHIRFTDDEDQLAEGEVFNSTEEGCCLDCSLTAAPPSCTSDMSDTAPLSVGHSSPSLSVNDEDDVCVFGTSSFSSELSLPSVSANQSRGSNNHQSHSLEPISGLLNPILNTMDSLDMYALAHLHNQPTAASQIIENDYSEDAVAEWQSLSHESLLTTNSLIPMKDNDCSVSSQESNSPSSPSELDKSEPQPLSFSALKTTPISFQFQTSQNIVHAMKAEGDEVAESCKTSLSLPAAKAAV